MDLMNLVFEAEIVVVVVVEVVGAAVAVAVVVVVIAAVVDEVDFLVEYKMMYRKIHFDCKNLMVVFVLE
jgi:hypothetical protein